MILSEIRRKLLRLLLYRYIQLLMQAQPIVKMSTFYLANSGKRLGWFIYDANGRCIGRHMTLIRALRLIDRAVAQHLKRRM
jgi:hypothetical protein